MATATTRPSWVLVNITVPRDARAGDILGIALDADAAANESGATQSITTVPEHVAPGKVFEVRVPNDGNVATEPEVAWMICKPKIQTADEMLAGFHDVRPTGAVDGYLSSWPLVVVRTPPPREGIDSLHSGIIARWDE